MKIYIVIERDGTDTLVETSAEAFRTKAEAYEYLERRAKQMNDYIDVSDIYEGEEAYEGNDVEVSNGLQWWSANIIEKELKA